MTAQNQRLVYWPMLKSGDSDMMPAQFDFYNRMLKNAELRSRVYWQHGGYRKGSPAQDTQHCKVKVKKAQLT